VVEPTPLKNMKFSWDYEMGAEFSWQFLIFFWHVFFGSGLGSLFSHCFSSSFHWEMVVSKK